MASSKKAQHLSDEDLKRIAYTFWGSGDTTNPKTPDAYARLLTKIYKLGIRDGRAQLRIELREKKRAKSNGE